eukprot:GEMP01069276.1.p1 GENE.GEMP01069276.1~~GEMP01069276.1.p1  ORF type:complete len:128 (+),score=36.55 GEMP01069276.1:370-753(+)
MAPDKKGVNPKKDAKKKEAQARKREEDDLRHKQLQHDVEEQEMKEKTRNFLAERADDVMTGFMVISMCTSSGYEQGCNGIKSGIYSVKEKCISVYDNMTKKKEDDEVRATFGQDDQSQDDHALGVAM